MPSLATFENELTGEGGLAETGFVFCQVTVLTKELMHLFPRPESSSPDQGKPSGPIKRAGGRLPQYEWDEFWAELIVKLHFDGFPETQAELVSQAAELCAEMWGEAPSHSVLKEKIAPIYNHPRWKPETEFPAVSGLRQSANVL